MTSGNLYRVTVKTTTSLQPTESYWGTDVVYCGHDVGEARAAYHLNEPQDYSAGYGNRCRRTRFEALDMTGLDDDDPGEMAVVDNIEDHR